MCQKTTESTNFFKVELKGSKAHPLSLDLLAYGGQIAEQFAFDYPFPCVERLTWLRINNIMYKAEQSVFLCPLRGNRRAQFGLLKDIVMFQGRFLFVAQMLTTKSFSSHYQAFKVSFNDFFNVIDPNCIDDFFVYSLHKPSFKRCREENMYIVTKREMFNQLLSCK